MVGGVDNLVLKTGYAPVICYFIVDTRSNLAVSFIDWRWDFLGKLEDPKKLLGDF